MTKEPAMSARKRKHPFWHFIGCLCSITITIVVIALLFIGFLYLRFSTGPIEHPKLVEFVENRINREIGDSELEIGQFQIHAKDLQQPAVIALKNVVLKSPQGQNMLSFPQAELSFSSLSAVQGDARPQELRIQDMNIAITRNENGRFNFQTQSATSDFEFGSINELLSTYAKIEWLQDLEAIVFDQTKIAYDDRLTGKRYVFDQADVRLSRTGKLFDLQSALNLKRDDFEHTAIQISMRHRLGNDTSMLKVGFENARPVHLAEQMKSLGWLRGVDAVASGSFLLEIAESKLLNEFSGVLDLRNGRIRNLLEETTPKFDHIKTYFTFHGDQEEFTINAMEVDAPRLKFTADGKANIVRNITGDIETLKTDLNLSKLSFIDRDVFSKTLELKSAHINADFTIDNFRVDIPKAIIKDDDSNYTFHGTSWINDGTWQNSYHIRVDQIESKKLMALWPIELIEKTRDWITKNITSGMVHDFHGTIATRNGKPNVDLSFLAQDVDTAFMRSMPPLQSATGVGRLTEKSFAITLTKGHVITRSAQQVDLAGSRFYVPDLQQKPTIAQIDLTTRASVPAALELLNVDQFQFIDKIGLPTDVAQGQLQSQGRLLVPLTKGLKTTDLGIEFSGDIQNLASEKLVKGKTIAANSVALKVDNQGMTIRGPIRFDGIETETRWVMGFGRGGAQTITSNLRLDQSSLRKLQVTLPQGAINGGARAQIDVELNKNAPANFQLRSDLKGMGVNLPTLGWQKPANASGNLVVNGTLGQSPKINNFAFSASGLSAKGTVDLGDNGSFQSANFENITLGNWFNTNATIIGQGNARKIVLNGGQADMRRFQFGNASGAGPIDVRLDKLVMNDDITLYNLRATRGANAGAVGQFSALLNNQAQITGTFQNGKFGTQIRINSANAGATLRAGGVMKTYRDGDLVLDISPQQNDGHFDGKFSIEGGRLIQSNGMTSLMNAMSVVGLLQQMKSQGIHFDKIIGDFAITPKAIQLKNISAVGPSMGMTVNGWYNVAQKSVDIEGVVTPLYVLNGAFQRVFGKLFGRQKGEGLFSFTYTMKGAANNPKVAVNPFSILTPGIFREIFRQNQPQPSQ